MPFNNQEYEQQCSRMSRQQLLREVERYDEAVAAAGAGTGLALLAAPLTMGISAIAIGGTAPALINARKKRGIARKFLAAAPEVRPNSSTHPIITNHMRQRLAVSREQEKDDDLPAYAEEGEAIDATEKQLYKTEEKEIQGDLPPTYDEATIKRMSMMGLSPDFHSSLGQQQQHDTTLSTATESGTGPSRSNSETPSLLPSLSEDDVHDRHDSTSSPHDSDLPRTPSPDRSIAGSIDTTNLEQTSEQPSEQRKSKGKSRLNPFASSEDGEKRRFFSRH